MRAELGHQYGGDHRLRPAMMGAGPLGRRAVVGFVDNLETGRGARRRKGGHLGFGLKA